MSDPADDIFADQPVGAAGDDDGQPRPEAEDVRVFAQARVSSDFQPGASSYTASAEARGDFSFHIFTQGHTRADDPGYQMVSERFRAKVRVGVEPPCYEVGWAQLDKSCQLLIAGPPGSGRETLALLLIDRLMRQLGEEQIEPRLITNAATLQIEPPSFVSKGQQRIYLLLAEGSGAAELSRETFQDLAGRVSQWRCYMLVIGPTRLAASLGVAEQVVLDQNQRITVGQVFFRHLESQLGELAAKGATAGRSSGTWHPAFVYAAWSEQLRESEAFMTTLAEIADLERASNLAHEVAERIIAEDDLAQLCALATRRAADWQARSIADWLVRAQSAPTRLCLTVAAAALAGAPDGEFFELAFGLYRRLNRRRDGSLDKELDDAWEELHRMPITAWCDEARAQLSEELEWQSERLARVQLIEPRPRGAGYQTIEAFWRLYPTQRSALLDWLRVLGQDGRRPIRIRVAVARTVGVLLLLEYGRINDEIIMRWIDGDRSGGILDAQETAALSLWAATGKEPTLADGLLRKLEVWTEPRRIFASALIYAWLGVDRPARFIEGMRRLVKEPTAWVLLVQGRTAQEVDAQLSAVRWAFRSYLRLARYSAADAAALFTMLGEWSESRSGAAARQVAAEVFCDMMSFNEAVDVRLLEGQPEPERVVMPILLRMLSRYPELTPWAADMLCFVAMLSERSFRGREGLRRMLRCAQSNQQARPALYALAAEVLRRKPAPAAVYFERWLRGFYLELSRPDARAADLAYYSRDLLRDLMRAGLVSSGKKQ